MFTVVYVYAWFPVCVPCAGKSMDIFEEAEVPICCIPAVCCVLILRHCFSLNWELADSAQTAARKPQESCFCCFSSTGITGTEYQVGLSIEGMGPELGSLSLCGIYLLIIPNLIIKLFIFNTALSIKF